MNEILQANIFFVIASIATVCFCILVCIALYQIIKILQSVRAIITRVEQGSAMLAEDIESLRSYFLEGGFWSRLLSMFFGGTKTSASRRSRSASNASIKNNLNPNSKKQHDQEKNRSI